MTKYLGDNQDRGYDDTMILMYMFSSVHSQSLISRGVVVNAV